MQEPIIGIDLGTTNSVVSILEDKLPKTLLVDGEKLLPSVVSLTPNGMIVGKVAKNMAILEPDKTVASIKRKIGQNIKISIGHQQLSPEEISAIILQKIRQAAIDHFQLSKEDTVRAVVTVPAYFTEEQRAATKQAAELANLKVERIINEPTAAALAYGMSSLEEAKYAVYDLGGGTFDISIIESDAGLVEVMASTGNNQLGGDDFDDLLAEKIWATFLKQNNLGDIQPTGKEKARLKRIAEQTKIKLSDQEIVELQESFFYKKEDLNYHLEQKISRLDFEILIKAKIEETVSLLKQAIQEADITRSDLDGIILVGGSSRIPLVSRLIAERLKITPALIDLPDEAVSHGATVQGAIIDNVEVDTVLVDITPHTLGIATVDDQTYSMDNVLKMMEQRKKIEEKEGEEEKVEEEIQADLEAAMIIPKNSAVPIKRTKRFYAESAFQKKYSLEVFQGEESRFYDNKIIGEAILEVKTPVEHGEIDVTFELDIDGLIKLTAVETTTKEHINAEFKSSKGQKVRKSQVATMEVVSTEETENTLIKRAEALLQTTDIEAEDKEELQELVDNYASAQAANNTAEAEKTEVAILDLLYYLEKEEVE